MSPKDAGYAAFGDQATDKHWKEKMFKSHNIFLR